MKKFLPLLAGVALLISATPARSVTQEKNTGAGRQIGGTAAEPIGFFGTTPAAQPAATSTNRAALQTLGLLAADGTLTATASSGAATLSQAQGTITSEALTTAGLAAYTLTLTNTLVTTSSIIVWSIDNGTNTQGTIGMGIVTPGTGSAVFKVNNLHATQALNGTIKIRYAILK